ncbi:uncharacterized protein A1O9_06574 [Exophiala aquamarina CBS 119918]|uniref:EthD domain-containing protein n=1 Tax=Exophiala aquamarina CBS 119918 TaxID=1182545 RepID=A0A072PH67_9EURO|nr:uncharacterized protein A1O9_06574 [Exophiala aquamarina CBS 119918]KEF58648.1 hypothetical protein A1O9_06574 [Exophiala aquamarina CBS 119918]
MSSSGKLRLCLLIPRKKGITEEEFHRHWANIHGPLVTDWMSKYGVIVYNQFHRVQHTSEAIGNPPQYDGIAEITFSRYEDMEAAYKDKVYLEKIRPDELRFIDFDNIVFSMGRDLTVVQDGKVVLPVETGY